MAFIKVDYFIKGSPQQVLHDFSSKDSLRFLHSSVGRIFLFFPFFLFFQKFLENSLDNLFRIIIRCTSNERTGNARMKDMDVDQTERVESKMLMSRIIENCRKLCLQKLTLSRDLDSGYLSLCSLTVDDY